jgi:hypothetical protein
MAAGRYPACRPGASPVTISSPADDGTEKIAPEKGWIFKRIEKAVS